MILDPPPDPTDWFCPDLVNQIQTTGAHTVGNLASTTHPMAFEVLGIGVDQTTVTVGSVLAASLALIVYRIRNRHNKHENTQRNTQ